MVRAASFPYIIWWAIAVHLVWGLMLVASEAVRSAAVLVGMHGVVGLGVSSLALGLVLICAASVAAVSLVMDLRLDQRLSVLLLMPQYALLVGAAIADTQTIITGQLNGVAVDRWLLTAALWPVMIGAVLHSLAIIERYHLWTRHSPT